MTWVEELSALGAGGVVTAILYWAIHRLSQRLEALLAKIQDRLSALEDRLRRLE